MTAGTKYPALFPDLSGEWVGIVLGVVFVVVAILLPDSLRGNAAAGQRPQGLADR